LKIKKLRFRFLATLLCTLLVMACLPVFTASAEVFEATLMGQLDADVSSYVDEWGIGDLPSASVNFSLGQEATISMSFGEPIKFTGNWTGISTNVPVASDEDAEALGGGIVSFVVDGVDLGMRYVPLINRDDSGFLTIDIARQWGGDYDAYDHPSITPLNSRHLEHTLIAGSSMN
jgi:hypothetical protein